MDNTKKLIAGHLLRIGAVFLRPDEPFTWASGIKSPIYCDNRLILSYPLIRKDVEAGLAELVRRHFGDAEGLFGTATAGIAHAALVADILDLPMGYVRSSAKEHGRTNRIEGRCEAGQKVVVVEDLISTAMSSAQSAVALQEVGCDVLGVISIFTYGMQAAADTMAEIGVPVESLTDLSTLLDVALEMGFIDERGKKQVLRFAQNPKDPSWQEE
ncbi:MAG TPA: orotate phosphoribosyltransferase [Clostridiales bacterium]|jgi:orotate phosphoribosyltransferase|nr:orotate phosphoribosyltransferase [Clostridiales bacterium]